MGGISNQFDKPVERSMSPHDMAGLASWRRRGLASRVRAAPELHAASTWGSASMSTRTPS